MRSPQIRRHLLFSADFSLTIEKSIQAIHLDSAMFRLGANSSLFLVAPAFLIASELVLSLAPRKSAAASKNVRRVRPS